MTTQTWPAMDSALHEFTLFGGSTCARCGTGIAWRNKACIPIEHCTAERLATDDWPRWAHDETTFVRTEEHDDHDCDFYRCDNCGREIRQEIER